MYIISSKVITNVRFHQFSDGAWYNGPFRVHRITSFFSFLGFWCATIRRSRTSGRQYGAPSSPTNDSSVCGYHHHDYSKCSSPAVLPSCLRAPANQTRPCTRHGPPQTPGYQYLPLHVSPGSRSFCFFRLPVARTSSLLTPAT